MLVTFVYKLIDSPFPSPSLHTPLYCIAPLCWFQVTSLDVDLHASNYKHNLTTLFPGKPGKLDKLDKHSKSRGTVELGLLAS